MRIGLRAVSHRHEYVGDWFRSGLGFSASVQHPAGDAEVFGGEGFVATGSLEHFRDNPVFEIGKGLLAESERNVDLHGIGWRQGRGHGEGRSRSRWPRHALDIRRKMCGFKRVSRAEEDGTFNQIPQLTNVSWEFVLC